MPVTVDIVESWRRPRAVMARLLARGPSEPFALSFLLLFLLLAFAASSPALMRQAMAAPDLPLLPRFYAAALGLLATIPLWYLLAALGHLVARALGGRGSHYGGRLALFWSLLAISPAMLIQGLAQGMVAFGPAANLLGLLVLGGFLALWVAALREVEA